MFGAQYTDGVPVDALTQDKSTDVAKVVLVEVPLADVLLVDIVMADMSLDDTLANIAVELANVLVANAAEALGSSLGEGKKIKSMSINVNTVQ